MYITNIPTSLVYSRNNVCTCTTSRPRKFELKLSWAIFFVVYILQCTCNCEMRLADVVVYLENGIAKERSGTVDASRI